MRRIVYSFLYLTFFCCTHANAQQKDSIIVQLNKEAFVQGDSISMEINLINYRSVAKTATIQLWIEEVKTGKQWRYRYPLVNGYVNAKLKVDSLLPDGTYAFNFLLQKKFFTLNGYLKNPDKHDKQLNYILVSRNKQMITDAAVLADQKRFTVKNLLFQDSAFIIFSRPGQKKNDLLIDIQTPLDSAFIPSTVVTKFITLGKSGSLPAGVPSYQFIADSTKYRIILPEVIVKTRSGKKLEDFANENVTGMFTGDDAIVLDGISSDEIANAPDLYFYLTIKAGGLRIVTDPETQTRSFEWRNQPVDIYINEMKLDSDAPLWINPSDIAMIKIFRPGTTLSAAGSSGGAIAIYTKTGEYQKATNRNYSFFIEGYTGLESTWR